MTKRLQKAGAWAAILAVLFGTQAHLALMQGVAWGGMLLSYSAESGIEQGIQQTFDGDHPCPLCTLVEDVRQADPGTGDELSIQKSVQRLLAMTSRPESTLQPNNFLRPVDDQRVLHRGSDPEPPTPPPPRHV